MGSLKKKEISVEYAKRLAFGGLDARRSFLPDKVESYVLDDGTKESQASARSQLNWLTQLIVPVYNEGENVSRLYQRLIEEQVPFDSLRFIYDSDDDTSLPTSRKSAGVTAASSR